MPDTEQISIQEVGQDRLAIQLGTPERRKAFRTYLDTLGLSNDFNTQNATIVFRQQDLTHVLAATAQILAELDKRDLLNMDAESQTLNFG